MERTAELKEYAGLILEGLKEKFNELPHGHYTFREEVELETDNTELENVNVIMRIENIRENNTLCYWIVVQSNTILGDTDNHEEMWIHIKGAPKWYGKVQWNPRVQPKGDLVDEVAEHIRLATEKAETLFFDKSGEQFISRDCPKAMRQYRKERLRQSIFADKRSFKSSNMCCVCNEHTITETPCGHNLCLVCWEKLEKKTCPLCRQEIKYRHIEDY